MNVVAEQVDAENTKGSVQNHRCIYDQGLSDIGNIPEGCKKHTRPVECKSLPTLN